MLIDGTVGAEFAKSVLQNICSDFAEGIIGKTVSFREKKKVSEKIDEVVGFVLKFEKTNNTLFLTDLQAAFSKENINEILRKAQQKSSFYIEDDIRNSLQLLCEQYNIGKDGHHIIDLICDVFFEVTCDCDSKLAERLYYNRLRKQVSHVDNKLSDIESEVRKLHTYFLFHDAKNGSIFILLQKKEPYFNNYFKHKNSFYYPDKKFDEYFSQLVNASSLVIKGRQGTGKTTLALRLGELFSKNNPDYAVLYTNAVVDWYSIIQNVNNSKALFPFCKFIWVIDNIHRIPEFEQDIVNYPFKGDDKYIFITRNIDKVTNNPYRIETSLWKDDNVIRLIIDNVTFSKYLFADPHYIDLTYREAEKIYSLCGGDFSLLEKYKMLYGKELSRKIEDEDQILYDIFDFYYPNYRYKYSYEDFESVLPVLFLGMIDNPIPPVMQNSVCQSMLGQLCYTNGTKELEFEHATVAELFFSVIVFYLQQDWIEAYERNINKVCHAFVSGHIKETIKAEKINTLILSVDSFSPTMPINKKNWNNKQHYTQLEGIKTLLCENGNYISPTTWKKILSSKKYYSANIKLFKNTLSSGAFFNSLLLTGDYNFRFIYKRVDEIEAKQFNDYVILNIRQLAQNMNNCSKTTALFRSLDAHTSIQCISALNRNTLINAMSNNDDGYYVVSCGFKYIEIEVVKAIEKKLGDAFIKKMIIESSLCALVQFLELLSEYQEYAFTIVEENKDLVILNIIETKVEFEKYATLMNRIFARDENLGIKIERLISPENYLLFLEKQGTFQNLLELLWCSSKWLRDSIITTLQQDTSLFDKLFAELENGKESIGHLNIYIHMLSMKSPDTWNQIEKMVTPSKFVSLISKKGTIVDLCRICSKTSEECGYSILSAFREDKNQFDNLIQQTIDKRKSLGSFGLSLRDLSLGLLQEFENIIRPEGLIELCRRNGNLAVLLRIMENVSEEMQKDISAILQTDKSTRSDLITNTIEDREKIGTFALWLRGLKQKNEKSLALFESAIGVDGILQILTSQGDLVIFARILEYSTDDMKNQLLNELEINPMTVDDLCYMTIENGNNINTFSFTLRELSAIDEHLLVRFENIVGEERYLTLFKRIGNIPAVYRILAYSSSSFRKRLIVKLKLRHNDLDEIIENTLKGGNSLGALCLSLREINKSIDVEKDEELDELIDAHTWIRLFIENGDLIAILKSAIEFSKDVRTNILKVLSDDTNDYTEKLLERCLMRNVSVGTLPLVIREYNKESDEINLFEAVVSPAVFNRLFESLGNISSYILSLGESSSEFLEIYRRGFVNKRLVNILLDNSIQLNDKLHNIHFGFKYLRRKNKRLLYDIEREIGIEGYEHIMISGIPLFQILKIAAYSSLGNEICKLIIEDEDIYNKLLTCNDNYSEMFHGFNVDFYTAIFRRNKWFEEIINDKLDAQRIAVYLSRYSRLEEFLLIMRWLRGDTIYRVIDYLRKNPELNNDMRTRWKTDVKKSYNDNLLQEAREVLAEYGFFEIELSGI